MKSVPRYGVFGIISFRKIKKIKHGLDVAHEKSNRRLFRKMKTLFEKGAFLHLQVGYPIKLVVYKDSQ